MRINVSNRDKRFIIYDIVNNCRSIPTITDHMVNRSLTLGNLWETVPKDKIFKEITSDLETLREKMNTINKLIMEELKCLI